jgi:2,4-dienoyl-CoA reductase-like NADH-dependent reductase (Old Yellow Enzyme family)
VHIAPRCDAHDVGDENPAETFGYLARELGARKVAFLFARESMAAHRLGPQLKEQFGGVFIANQQLTRNDALQLLSRAEADAVSWGVLYIANPDLAERMIADLPLNPPNEDTFYGGGAEGYTDYPVLASTV